MKRLPQSLYSNIQIQMNGLISTIFKLKCPRCASTRHLRLLSLSSLELSHRVLCSLPRARQVSLIGFQFPRIAWGEGDHQEMEKKDERIACAYINTLDRLRTEYAFFWFSYCLVPFADTCNFRYIFFISKYFTYKFSPYPINGNWNDKFDIKQTINHTLAVTVWH